MKNKLLVMICICILAVSMLVACGSSSQDASTTDNAGTAQEENTQDTGEELLKINPEYVAVDDDNLKMTITSVGYEELTSQTQYIVHYTLENKRDDVDISVDAASDACAVNGYTVEFANGDNTAKSGRINDIANFVATSDISSGFDHITKLEDLLTFEADVTVTVYKDTGSAHEVQDRYNVKINLNDN